jgi:hypothetical protein
MRNKILILIPFLLFIFVPLYLNSATPPPRGTTTLGDMIYGGTTGAQTRLAGNTTATKLFLTQTGNGSVSAAPGWNAIVAGDVPTLNQNTTGNAATATALAANPSDCGSDTYATTIAASGNLTCASITNASTTATSANTLSAIVARDSSGNFSAGTISAALTGNSSTATALAADPADCASDTYATTIAASGALTCASVTNASTTATSANTASAIVARDATITAALTGNASTATALAANPADCSANQFATTIAASGALTCEAPVAVTTIGSSANANGLTLSGKTINLEPASASFGGIVTTGTQTMAGAKTWSGAAVFSSSVSAVGTTTVATAAGALPASGTTGITFFQSGSPANPCFAQVRSGNTANKRIWDTCMTVDGQYSLRAVADDYSSARAWLTATGGSGGITTVAFPEGNVTMVGDLSGDGGDQLVGFLQNQIASSTTSLTIAQCGSTVISNSADVMTLPEASTALGCQYTIVCGTADDLDINPADGTDQISVVNSVAAGTAAVITPSAGDAIRCTDIGSSIVLEAIGANLWAAVGVANGAWTDVD